MVALFADFLSFCYLLLQTRSHIDKDNRGDKTKTISLMRSLPFSSRNPPTQILPAFFKEPSKKLAQGSEGLRRNPLRSIQGDPQELPQEQPKELFTDFPGKLSEDLSQEKSIEFSKDSLKDVL